MTRFHEGKDSSLQLNTASSPASGRLSAVFSVLNVSAERFTSSLATTLGIRREWEPIEKEALDLSPERFRDIVFKHDTQYGFWADWTMEAQVVVRKNAISGLITFLQQVPLQWGYHMSLGELPSRGGILEERGMLSFDTTHAFSSKDSVGSGVQDDSKQGQWRDCIESMKIHIDKSAPEDFGLHGHGREIQLFHERVKHLLRRMIDRGLELSEAYHV